MYNIHCTMSMIYNIYIYIYIYIYTCAAATPTMTLQIAAVGSSLNSSVQVISFGCVTGKMVFIRKAFAILLHSFGCSS